jgi:hypothetical protein
MFKYVLIAIKVRHGISDLPKSYKNWTHDSTSELTKEST